MIIDLSVSNLVSGSVANSSISAILRCFLSGFLFGFVQCVSQKIVNHHSRCDFAPAHFAACSVWLRACFVHQPCDFLHSSCRSSMSGPDNATTQQVPLAIAL